MKRTGKHCSDCGAELKRVHREGYPPYKCCVSKTCEENHRVRMAPVYSAGPSDAVLRNMGGNSQ